MKSKRLEIGLKRGVPDARGKRAAETIRRFLDLPVSGCITRDVYKIGVPLTRDEFRLVQAAFTDPVTCRAGSRRLRPPRAFDWLVEVGFKPGVTDNVGRTARALIEDVIERAPGEDEHVSTGVQYFFQGAGLTRQDMARAASQVLANELIHSISIFSPPEWQQHPVDLELPAMPATEPTVRAIDLEVDDHELLRISRTGILSLNLDEMRAIRDYYRQPEIQARRQAVGLPPGQPTDIELEALAQTWSEHCCHKIFNAIVDYEDERGQRHEVDSLFKTYIKASTREIAGQVDWLVSVFVDNAGVIRFNERLNTVFKVETHNSPSALDPYGGAITGIVGCNRDPMGTGMGAELLCNTWGYCLASPFHQDEVPEGLFHPRIVRDGVHHGVIDGGNQSGIPYARGFERFDPRYLGKPLVYCGTVGLLPTSLHGRPAEQKRVMVGDRIVMVGGRIGKDGIHGATFSSEELRGESPAQAVQIGDPITQRNMYEFLLEAREAGLYRAITDNGAGGLSSSVGEMAEYTGGMDLDLTHAPLKYQGLQPWEIYLSEAQERMTLAVAPETIKPLLDLARRRHVEITDLGHFTDSGEMLIRYRGQIIARLHMAFLHEGCPRMRIPATWRHPAPPPPPPPRRGRRDTLILRLLGRLNICSREFKARQYDHEVKARTVIKPFVGAHCDVPSDATILLAEYGRREGIVLAEGINPFYSDLDPYRMAASAVDEAYRRIIAVGGRTDRIATLDNFCWPDPVLSEKTPDGPFKMGQLVRACQALRDITTAYRAPLISGKDSMKNDSMRGGVKISIPPTLLISAIGKIDDIHRALTLSFKEAGDLIFILGLTRRELGASEFYRMLAEEKDAPERIGGDVPAVHANEALSIYRTLEHAIRDGLLRSAHTPTLGGIAIGLALCAIGGDLGAEIDLSAIPVEPGLDSDATLFSESNSRFLLTCRPEHEKHLLERLAPHPHARIGQVVDSGELHLTERLGKTVANLDVAAMRRAYKKTLDGI